MHSTSPSSPRGRRIIPPKSLWACLISTRRAESPARVSLHKKLTQHNCRKREGGREGVGGEGAGKRNQLKLDNSNGKLVSPAHTRLLAALPPSNLPRSHLSANDLQKQLYSFCCLFFSWLPPISGPLISVTCHFNIEMNL